MSEEKSTSNRKHSENSSLFQAAKTGDLETVKRLVKGDPSKVNDRGKHGETALYHAAENGNFRVLEYLVGKNANDRLRSFRNEDMDYSPLQIAVRNSHSRIVEHLFAIENARYNTGKKAAYVLIIEAFLLAIETGGLDMVKLFVEKCRVDIDFKHLEAGRPIFSAVRKGHLNVVKYLVGKGVDITTTDSMGETLIDIAKSHEHQNIVDFLIATSINRSIDKLVECKQEDSKIIIPELHNAASAVNNDLARLRNILGIEPLAKDHLPDHLKCPITCEMMIEPVMMADGHTCDRTAIEKWFYEFNKDTSPKTLEKLANLTLTSNHNIRMAIDSYIDEQLLSIQHSLLEKKALVSETGIGDMDEESKSNDMQEQDVVSGSPSPSAKASFFNRSESKRENSHDNGSGQSQNDRGVEMKGNDNTEDMETNNDDDDRLCTNQ